MRWTAEHGDILDVPADVLVCSANPFLTLSGGVGGAFLERYGSAMQDELRALLDATGKRHVDRGSVWACAPCGSPYLGVIHAVAVDGMYESSPDVIEASVERALMLAAEFGARSVAIPALATGYGRLTIAQFADGIAPLIARTFPPLECVKLVMRDQFNLESLVQGLGDRVQIAS